MYNCGCTHSHDLSVVKIRLCFSYLPVWNCEVLFAVSVAWVLFNEPNLRYQNWVNMYSSLHRCSGTEHNSKPTKLACSDNLSLKPQLQTHEWIVLLDRLKPWSCAPQNPHTFILQTCECIKPQLESHRNLQNNKVLHKTALNPFFDTTEYQHNARTTTIKASASPCRTHGQL